MNERFAIQRLCRWAGYERNWCFPNVHFCGCEMDMAVVTRSRLLWEIEVKLTLADWRADEQKAKWQSPERSRVARMFYAVRPDMIHKVPSFVPRETGLLVLDDTYYVNEVRPARLMRNAKRVTDTQLLTLFESAYYRFWRERHHRHLEQKTRTHLRKLDAKLSTTGEKTPPRIAVGLETMGRP